MNKKSAISLIATLIVVFGCVERKYDEENYPVVVEIGNDVEDNEDILEEQDITISEEETTIEDAGDPMDQEDLDQFTDFNEEETRGMEPDTATLIEDIQTLLADADSTNIDSGNPKYPPCSGTFAKSCKHRCAYNANCPCQCDKACVKAKDCCKDMTQFCPIAEEDKDAGADVPDIQLADGECPKLCAIWYDGCNTCQCKDGKIAGCTKLACPTKKEPYCKKQKT